MARMADPSMRPHSLIIQPFPQLKDSEASYSVSCLMVSGLVQVLWLQVCLRTDLSSVYIMTFEPSPHSSPHLPTVSCRMRKNVLKHWVALFLSWTAGESTGPWQCPEPLVRGCTGAVQGGEPQACSVTEGRTVFLSTHSM